MKKYLMLGLLLLILALTAACSEQKDDTTNSITGNVVADLGNQPAVEQQETTVSVIQKEDKIINIDVLGKNGIEPKELKVKLGDKLRFYNKDPANKDMEITMRLGRTNKFITTPVVKPNTYTEYFFTEAGDYTYWTIGYGIQAKIEVVN